MPDRPPPKIDRELSKLLAPLGADEVLQLENNLLADGEAISPIVVWEETNLIIDGNYRFYLCTKYNLPYQIKYKSFASRGAVIGWIISHQLGRRNLTPQQCGFAEAAMGARAAGIYRPE
jgi:hypothetical protein